MEVRRFGVGQRRAEGPAGTSGVEGVLIHSDARGVITELAFAKGGRIEPHDNPNTTWFIVIEGGGWVLVGDEKTRIAAGEAAFWPAGQVHGAWTEHSQLRAFMVELAGADDSEVRGILEWVASVPHPALPPASPGEGQLAPRDRLAQHDPSAGEPL